MKSRFLIMLIFLLSFFDITAQSFMTDKEAFYYVLKVYDYKLNEAAYRSNYPDRVPNWLYYYAMCLDEERYDNAIKDEFERQSYLNSVAQEINKGLSMVDLKKKFIVKSGTSIGEYDFEKKSFPIDWEAFYKNFMYLYHNSDNGFRIGIGRVMNLSDFDFQLLMAPDLARSFINSMKSGTGEINRNIEARATYNVVNYRLERNRGNVDFAIYIHKIEFYTYPNKKIGEILPKVIWADIINGNRIQQEEINSITYEGKSYKCERIGSQIWMTENLAFLPKVYPSKSESKTLPAYYVYNYQGQDISEAKSTENYQKYGVLYNSSAALNGNSFSDNVPSGVRGICPPGWHLPSEKEWEILFDYVSSNVIKIKSSTDWLTGNGDNSSHFNALPSGLRSNNFNRPVFEGLGKVGYWLSSSEGTGGNVRVMICSDYLHISYGDCRNGFSIRCIKD